MDKHRFRQAGPPGVHLTVICQLTWNISVCLPKEDWQETIRKELMQLIIESKVLNQSRMKSYEDALIYDEIEYENMPDVIDPKSEELLDDEILKSKLSH